MTVAVRPLERNDETAWRRLWSGYLDFYEMTLPNEVTANTFQCLLEDARYFGRIADVDGSFVGFVHCIFHPSTGSLSDRCYLQDLFVEPSARGAGVGRALIEAAYLESDNRGSDRIYWHTHKDNRTARQLYDRLASVSDFVQYRR
jgi:GNAT superfamily N-acetyltransferase